MCWESEVCRALKWVPGKRCSGAEECTRVDVVWNGSCLGDELGRSSVAWWRQVETVELSRGTKAVGGAA